MNTAEYKSATLARPDVDDIVMLEPVEKRPKEDKSGYEVVVLTTDSGRTIVKYDVHLMRVIDGVKKFDKEQIAIIDEGLETEEVVFRSPSSAKQERVASKLERFINQLPYLDVSERSIDPEAKNARFTALKDNKDGTATEVEVFAYIKQVKGGENETLHVEITK